MSLYYVNFVSFIFFMDVQEKNNMTALNSFINMDIVHRKKHPFPQACSAYCVHVLILL